MGRSRPPVPWQNVGLATCGMRHFGFHEDEEDEEGDGRGGGGGDVIKG